MRLLLCLLVSLVTIPGFSQYGPEPVLVTDLLKIRSLSGVTINKEGNRALFTVTSIEPENQGRSEFRYANHMWVVSTDGRSKPRQLTFRENATQPAWSPDGTRIAFVRTVDQKSQIFILGADGGEARQLTHSRYGATAPRWSPDGTRILFSSTIPLQDLVRDSLLNPHQELPSWSMEKPGFINNEFLRASPGVRPDPNGSLAEVRAWLETNVHDQKARVFNKLNFQDESDINEAMNFTRLFILEVDGIAQPTLLSHGFFRYGGADFTPDGEQIVFSGNRDPAQHPDRALESEIYIMDVDGTGLRKLYGEKGKIFISPVVSPSGKWIAFQHGNTSSVSIPTLAVAPISGGNYQEIYLDRPKSNITWSPDEKSVYFTASSNGGNPLFRADIVTKKVEMLGNDASGTSSFDITRDRIVFVRTEVANPFELYISDRNGKNPKRISSFNSEWIANKKLSFPEKHVFTNELGHEVEYWVMKPITFTPGRKYPLLLEIHGGPSSMWGPGEASMWHEFQYFCGKGYGVVYANPRGSGGYGLEFLRANINDWGAGPSSDVLKAMDRTIAEGWADTSALFTTGGSYAGYLVTWIIAHNQRFKAACVQRGVYDLSTFFGEGNAWRLVPNYFGGYPWEAAVKATLDRESPISYVDRIRTPLIIFHGDNDRRTGFVQSEMLYRSLKALGQPVEYVRHPNATHEITRSGNNRQRIDQMLRTWEFFERWK